MNSRFINMDDYIGKTYGRLTILKEIPIKNKGKRRVQCKCSCGNYYKVDLYSLKRGFTRSCGCYNTEIRKITCSNNFHKGPNKIIKYDDYAEIIIIDNENNEKCRSLIDLDDIDKVSKYRWVYNSGYIMTNVVGGTNILLHRFIFNSRKLVDHINRNRLDNRKNNLREATTKENTRNAGLKSTNKSGIAGVWWDNDRSKWASAITVDGKKKYLGRYFDKNEAIKIRQQAEIKYFGEFAPCLQCVGGDSTL